MQKAKMYNSTLYKPSIFCMAYCIFIFTTGVDIEFQATLIAANDYLQKCYINSRYSPTVDEWPPYQPRHYTTLALIHHKDKCTDATVISVTQELAVAGKIQPKVEGLSSSGGSMSQTPNIYSNTTKNISDIFVSVKASDGLTINPCIILIEGAPGIGKTVLAKEIAFQWANNKLLRDKKILLLLFLRECNFKSMVSVENLVEHVVGSNEINASLTKYLLRTDGKDLAIVFDGYDEISEEDRKNSIIARIIYRRIFGKCCLVITSRPTASSNLHSVVDCRVEIVGFTEEDRLDYIQTALKGNDDKVRALTLFLHSNPTINALCYIPLNTTILLCLAEDGIDKLPKTQTDMYKKFIEMTILRFIQKVDTEVSKVITSIADLPHPHDKVFGELTRLAYNTLKIDKIVFRLNEIKEIYPNLAMISSNWNGLGLLKAVKYFNTEIGNVTSHFLHFSIQEYMAALYISTLSSNKQIKLLNKTFWQHRYYNFWIMYVGITCGSSFALKHFLSGNWFQLSTRIFKSSSICRKFLENKIKCLHLFQCLVESNNEDMIASVSQFFQGNQIDLSNQTLLPSHVNTLGFFLMRSINKQWEMLNLSGCNIGSIGINILCDRFLSKESREIVFIKTVDFSYNQLNYSSVKQIFDLFKSWHTSQLIIKDSQILQDHASSDMYKAVEDAFFTSDYDNQVCLELGPFLFGHKINILPRNAVSIKNLYLLNCKLPPITTSLSNLELLAKKSLSEIHLINTPLPNQEMKRLCCNLLNTGNPSLFIYNPELPDQDADEICSLIFSSHKRPNGIMLIISNSKVQGIINTSTISEQLTKLEILNLAVNVNHKCSNHMETFPWKGNLYCDGSNNNFIDHIFIELLYKITCNKWNWQLKILLKEKDILIAHRVNHESICEKIRMYQSLKAIYLSNYNIRSAEYQMLFDTETTLTKLYICNSYVDQYWLTTLRSNLLACKEIFIHSLCHNILRHYMENCSTVLVTKNEMFGCNPTTKQIALAFQLEKSINVLKLLHCQRSFDCFDQIITMLTTQNSWTELDFMNCELGEIEYDILQKHLKINKQNSTIKKLKVSSKQLTKLLVPKFIATIFMWKVQQIIFYDISHTVYECFVTKFTTTIPIDLGKIFLSVTYNSNKDIYFCNYSWNQITKLLERNSCAALYIVNCYFSLQPENLNIIILSHISKLHITNSSLHEDTMVNILETFVERKLEISICNTSKHIDDQALYNFITSKKLLYQSRVNFVAVMKNFMCGYNTTKNQLQFLQSQKLNDLEHTIVTLVSDTKQTHEKQLFIFQNKQLTALHFVGKDSETKFFIALIAMLKRISTLKCLGVEKYTITSEVATDIANILSHNKELKQLYFSKLQATDLLKIMKVLKFMNLRVLEIGNITDQITVTEYLTLIISCNAQLQYFSITNGDLYTTNVIKISKAVQNTSNLQELTITGNNTGATNIIAANNSKTQNLYNLDDNMQAACIQVTAKGLQNPPTLANVHASSNNITIEDITGAFSCNIQLLGLDTNENSFRTIHAIAIIKALQTRFKKICISNNITDEVGDDIAAVICNNSLDLLQEFHVSKCNLQSRGAIKIAKALQNISTLTKLYINNNHITDKVADDIGTILSCNTQLQELDISNNWFQAMGITKITKGLQKISTLKRLYICNNISGEAVDDIAAAISTNTRLQEINLSNNDFQSTGAIKIAKALQNMSTLTNLNISKNNITEEAVDDIEHVLYRNTQLQHINIGFNRFSSKDMVKIGVALCKMKNLRVLQIERNEIGDTAAYIITEVISSNTKLEKFNCSNNNFSSRCIVKIIKALQGISTLTKLYINNCNITDEAADDIAVAICSNPQLQELNISENNLQSTGAIKIAKALLNISTITKLYISNNNSTDKAADDIATAIYSNPQLQELNISENNLQSIGAIKITKVLQNISTLTKLYISNNNITDEAADDIAAVIYSNTQLQEVDVSKNHLQSTGAIKIGKALQNISTLTKLYLNNNHITDLAADDIAIALSRNTQLQELDISENNFQATGAKIIIKALQNGNILRKLYISNNNITAKAADDIAAVIYSNTQLQEVDVSKNNLQSRGTIKIAKALESISTLTKLYINNNHITDLAADDIATVLSRNTQLQELDISENNFQTTGAKIITKALQNGYTLRKLYISNNNITAEAADDIAAVLTRNTILQEFDVSKNNLQSTGAIKIAKALQNISTLTKLYLNNNHITDLAAEDIAAVLSCNTQLQEVDVSRNNFQSTGAIKIAKALQNISTLTKLYLNHNHITDLAADDIATVLTRNTQLQELDISENNFQTTGAKIITKALQSGYILRKLYISNNNITAEAADDIAAVIYSNTQLQEVDVSKNNLQSRGTIKIAKALESISTLTKLYINNNHVTDLAADDIATVFTRNTQLQELDISENNFQTTGAKIITKALQSGYILRKLYISNNNITAEAADDIAAVIYSNTQLQEVDVSRNNLQSRGAIKIAKALQNSSTLTKLYINNNHITDLAADDIATVLTRNTQLQEFDVSKNNLQSTGAIKVAKALQNISTLTKLYINNNHITDLAADDIAAVIYSSTQLQEVDVSRNSFQSTGAIKIAKALQNISTLTKLYLNHNHITDLAADDIATVLTRNTQLQELDISENNFQTMATKPLRSGYILRKLCKNNIAAVSHNTHLQELDISNNQIKAVGITKIAKALQSNATLKKLYMSRITMTDKAADVVATALSFNVQLQELDISKNMLQTNGIKLIAKVLQGIVTLTKLYINENCISDDAADDIAAVIHSNTQLQEFDVSKNTFQVLGTTRIATALQSVSTLTKLYINNNNITSESADDIAAVICCNIQLQEFNISENKLQATGVIIIAKALQSISTLKKLYISNNIYIGKNAYTEGALSELKNTTEKAAYSFAEAVSHNTKLQEIDFSENYLPTTGIVKIMQVLQSIFTVNKLYIINNNITEEAADDFAAALAFNTQLQELDISRNNLQTQGTIKIAKALQGIFTLKILHISNNNIADDAADDIAAALSHSYQLEVFSINGNYVRAPGMIKIARALQQISTLQRLCINRNRITDEAADAIVAVCSHNTQLQELSIYSNRFTNTKIVELKDCCHKLNCNLNIL